jgi:hypothetical protein
MMSNHVKPIKSICITLLNNQKESGRGHNRAFTFLFTATRKTNKKARNSKGNNDYKSTMCQRYKMIGYRRVSRS